MDDDAKQEEQTETPNVHALFKGLVVSLESISERLDAVLRRAREALERIEAEELDRRDTD